MALSSLAASRRVAISGAVALLLLVLCGAVQGGSVAQEGASAQARDTIVQETVAVKGRSLTQIQNRDSNCDDCACVKVECATYCESANNIESFTCDEAGWFSDGSFLCTCYPPSNPSGSTSAAPATSLGRLAIAVSAMMVYAIYF